MFAKKLNDENLEHEVFIRVSKKNFEKMIVEINNDWSRVDI